MWIALVLVAAIVAVICWLRFKPKPADHSIDDVSVIALRNAVSTAGGSPTGYDDVTLLRQLITAWGGTPASYDIISLLKQGVTVVGGTPTQTSQTMLLRELITTLGGTPASYNADTLFEQLGPIATIGLHTLSLSKATFLNGIADSGTINGANAGSVITSSGTLPTGFSFDSPSRTWAWMGGSTVTPGSFTLIETKAGVTGSPKSSTINYYGSVAAFTLTDIGSAAASSVQTSNAITISGVGPVDSIPVTLTGDASRVLLKNGSVVSNSTTGVNGDQFAVRLTASATDSVTVNGTLTIGTTADTFSVTTLSSTITAPVSTQTSTAGAAPLTWDEVFDLSNTYAGYTYEVQIANNNSSDFTTVAQDILHLLTESEITSGSVDISSDGYVTPPGAYSRRSRIVRDDGVTSPWSNVLTGTITSATTTWTTGGVTGNTAVSPDKAAGITVTTGSPLVATGQNSRGVNEYVRATAQSVNAVWEARFTVNALGFYIGLDDGTRNFSTYFGSPSGESDSHGMAYSVSTTQTDFHANTDASPSQNFLSNGTWAVNDVGSIRRNRTTGAFELWKQAGGSGSFTQVGGTKTVAALSSEKLIFGCANAQGCTLDCGQSGFTPAAGYSIHG